MSMTTTNNIVSTAIAYQADNKRVEATQACDRGIKGAEEGSGGRRALANGEARSRSLSCTPPRRQRQSCRKCFSDPLSPRGAERRRRCHRVVDGRNIRRCVLFPADDEESVADTNLPLFRVVLALAHEVNAVCVDASMERRTRLNVLLQECKSLLREGKKHGTEGLVMTNQQQQVPLHIFLANLKATTAALPTDNSSLDRVMRLLLKGPCDEMVESKQTLKVARCMDKKGNTPLHYACANLMTCTLSCLMIFVDEDATLWHCRNDAGETPMMLLLETLRGVGGGLYRHKLIRFLLQRGKNGGRCSFATPSPFRSPCRGSTPLLPQSPLSVEMQEKDDDDSLFSRSPKESHRCASSVTVSCAAESERNHTAKPPTKKKKEVLIGAASDGTGGDEETLATMATTTASCASSTSDATCSKTSAIVGEDSKMIQRLIRQLEQERAAHVQTRQELARARMTPTSTGGIMRRSSSSSSSDKNRALEALAVLEEEDAEDDEEEEDEEEDQSGGVRLAAPPVRNIVASESLVREDLSFDGDSSPTVPTSSFFGMGGGGGGSSFTPRPSLLLSSGNHKVLTCAKGSSTGAGNRDRLRQLSSIVQLKRCNVLQRVQKLKTLHRKTEDAKSAIRRRQLLGQQETLRCQSLDNARLQRQVVLLSRQVQAMQQEKECVLQVALAEPATSSASTSDTWLRRRSSSSTDKTTTTTTSASIEDGPPSLLLVVFVGFALVFVAMGLSVLSFALLVDGNTAGSAPFLR